MSKQPACEWDRLNNADRAFVIARTRQTALDRISYFNPASAFAFPEPHREWQRKEFHYFFFNDVFQRITDKNAASDAEIQAVVLTAEASDQFMPLCLSPYWMWKLVSAAVQTATRFPLTSADFTSARYQLMNETQSLVAKYAGGMTDGNYSGPVTAWHICQRLKAGTLNNSTSWRNAGIGSGLLLAKDPSTLPKNRAHYLELIVNPLLAPMANLNPSGT